MSNNFHINGFETDIPIADDEANWLHITRERPRIMSEMHWHQHIEINYLHNCTMTYQIADRLIEFPVGKLGILWASLPHKVVKTKGEGDITCIYLPLHEFRTWDLPLALHSQLMHNGIVIAEYTDDAVEHLMKRWFEDCQHSNSDYKIRAIEEIRAQLKRLTIGGWNLSQKVTAPKGSGKSIAYTEAILEYISLNFNQDIGIKDIAEHVDLHPNYAISIFRRVMGMPITAYLTRHRLSHAQALLLNTDQKIIDVCLESGFNSQSRFYEAFTKHLKTTPKHYREKWREISY